jgi:peptide/nickel transport system permease protein
MIANMGGQIDEILTNQIKFNIAQQLQRNPSFRNLPEDQRERLLNERIEIAIKAAGLDKPFLERSIVYLTQALTLDLGRAMFLRSAAGSSRVSEIVLERLPMTVLLFTTGTFLEALFGIYVGLKMARKALKKLDRVMTIFAVITYVVPPWFFGILFILFFSFYLRLFPAGGFVSVPPPEDPFLYTLDFLHHLSLPLITWVFAFFGFWAYITRNLVIQIMHEDYVVAARAKGLPERTILFRYVLKPASPPIVTNLALAIIASWTGAIITETVFSWPGIGLLFWEAILALDAPIVIGITVVYAYLLVATVFLLDIIYAILDPRVRAMPG